MKKSRQCDSMLQAPLPVDSWEGLRDALVEGPICPQLDIFKKEYKGDEDCLYLNVYTPKVLISHFVLFP